MKKTFWVLPALFVLASCREVPVSYGLATTGTVVSPDGRPLDEESFSLCLDITYNKDGKSEMSTECFDVLTKKDGTFSKNINWKNFYTKYIWEKKNAHSMSIGDYSVYIGGAPHSAVETQSKPTIVEIFNEPYNVLRLSVHVSPMELKVANIWHQASLVNNFTDREKLLEDFIHQYSNALTAEQAVNVATSIMNETDQQNIRTYYRDNVLLAFADAEKARLTANDKIELVRNIESESIKNQVLGI